MGNFPTKVSNDGSYPHPVSIIQERRHHSSKVFCFFVDFQKDFDSVLREVMFQRLKDISIFQILIVIIMRLYEVVHGHLCTSYGLSNFIKNTNVVKQGCPFSPTLFKMYIDELKSFLHEHIQPSNHCLLHHVLISILLFIDDVVLLTSTLEGLQRELDALVTFCDPQELTVNLGKTKVMISNCSNKTLSCFNSYLRGRRLRLQ